MSGWAAAAVEAGSELTAAVSSGGGSGRQGRGWDAAAMDAAAARVWRIAADLAARYAPGDVKLPGGPRTRTVDWVREGKRMEPAEVARLAARVAALLAAAPPYPDAAAAAGRGSGVAAGSVSGSGGDGEGGSRGSGGGGDSEGGRGAGGRMFSGRGVVMVGGGLRYLVPAWVSLHLLRRAGCTLPVELWFPAAEFPPPEAEAALGRLGVTCRRLGMTTAAAAGAEEEEEGMAEAGGGDVASGPRGGWERGPPQRGFGVKAAALLMSSFREVLFLDSDNGPLRDPTPLLESAPYRETGALLWPDFWHPSAAAELPAILNISAERLPRGTFESGQMLIDKARHWRGLLLATYLNLYGNVFAELLTGYIGKGDKETFAYGMLAAGEAVWTCPVPAGSAGLMGRVCRRRRRRKGGGKRRALGLLPLPGGAGGGGDGGRCSSQFMGNTMLQHGPDGAPLFLHANYHKWDLRLPAAFQDGWHRRWQLLQPGGRSVAAALYGNASGGAGYDVELYVYDVLRGLRCAAWLPALVAAEAERARAEAERARAEAERARAAQPPLPAAAAASATAGGLHGGASPLVPASNPEPTLDLGLDLSGFHPVPDYTTFRDYYRAGWTGPVEQLAAPPLGLSDRLAAWYFGGPRWRLRVWGRRLCRWRRWLLPRALRCKRG